MPAMQEDYLKAVVSGMKIAAHGGAQGILSGLKNRKDPIADCGIGAVNLAVSMRMHSGNTMPIQAMIPASYTLMLQALSLVERMGLAKIGNDELEHATRAWSNRLFTALKISPAMLQQMASQTHGIMQDPAKMELLGRRAGILKDPRASEPTPVPGGENGV